MQMSTEARAAADELIARVETRLILLALHPEDGEQHAASIEAMLWDADQAGRCPRIVIWRLRKRLAQGLHPAPKAAALIAPTRRAHG